MNKAGSCIAANKESGKMTNDVGPFRCKP